MRGARQTTRSGALRQKSADNTRGVAKYEPHLAIAAAYMYAQGASDDEVAAGLGVSQSSVLRWAKTHPEFSKARSESKLFVKARLANALISSAEGARKIEIVESWNPETKVWEPTKRKVTELPPNPAAILAWLQAQEPREWKQKQEVVVEVGTDTAALLQSARERMAAQIRKAQEPEGADT